MMSDWRMKCNYCETSKPDLRRCTKCFSVYYCSRECQRQDWAWHSKSCNDNRGDRTSPDSNKGEEESKLLHELSALELVDDKKNDTSRVVKASNRQEGNNDGLRQPASNTSQLDEERANKLNSDSVAACNYCSKSECNTLCSRCKDIFYCSKVCQKADWSSHRRSCINKSQKKQCRNKGSNNVDDCKAGIRERYCTAEQYTRGTVEASGHVTASQSDEGICNSCSAGGSTKKCAGCKAVFYCSKDCQTENWTQHKKVCKKIRRQEKETMTEDDIILTEDEQRIIEERQIRMYCLKLHFDKIEEQKRLGLGFFFEQNKKLEGQLTAEQLRVIKRAPNGSLELAVQYATRRLPNWNILLNIRDVPREDDLLAALLRPTAKHVLVAFIFMYHDHVGRHSVYLKDARDKITHAQFYFDHVDDDPRPYFSYEQLVPGNYILLKNPRIHLFVDGQVGMRINEPGEVMIYSVGPNLPEIPE